MEQRATRGGRQVVKEGKLAHLDEFETSHLFSERERVALRYADAVTWNPDLADTAMWADLHKHFTDPELVEMGQCIAMHAGEQRWIYTLHIKHGEFLASTTAGLTKHGSAELKETVKGARSRG